MGHLGVDPFRTEVPYKKPHGGATPRRLLRRPALPGAIEKLLISVYGIGIGDHQGRIEAFPGAERHPSHLALLGANGRHRRITAHRAPLPFDEAHHTVNQCTRAAHGKVHPEAALKMGNERVDRRGVEGIASDEKGMKAKHHAQPLIGKVATDEPINRLIAGISDQIRSHG